MTLRALIWCAVSSQTQAADDKISLEEQERAAREFAVRQGYRIVAKLVIPGHSRWESDPITALEEFAREGVFAYHELRQMWQQHAFDVLICYTHSRLGRSFTMQSWVIENVIRSGAKIYRLQGGWIDPVDYLPQIAMGGMSSAGEVDRLRKAYQVGMTERAKRGLPIGSHVPLSHKVVRDERGRSVGIAINEESRRLFNDLATVLLTGAAWLDIPIILFEEYGHGTVKGKPYAVSVLWRNLHSPWLWGHGARKYSVNKGRHTLYGIWGFDPSAPAPEGALIFRNTHEPIYTGDLAISVMSELRRRSQLNVGRANKKTASPFTGLIICGACGYRMSYKRPSSSQWDGYTCLSRGPRYRLHERHTLCDTNPRSIKTDAVHEWFDRLLQELFKTEDVSLIMPRPVPEPDRVGTIEGEIEVVERRIAGLLLQRVDTPPASQSVLSELILRADAQLVSLRTALDTAIRGQQDSEYQRRIADTALTEIRHMSLETFWKQAPETINRLLFAILGDYKVAVRDGEIKGLVKPPR